LTSVVKAVKFEEVSDKLGTKHTGSSLQNFFSIWVLPVETRLSLFYLFLVVNYLENARTQLGSELSKDTVGLKGLNDQIL
jgi:hypothetical protein